MLKQLRIENFVLVENICFEFGENLNIITGETGAGKSLMVDALGLLLGERASNQYIRTGAERALVEGYFTYEHPSVGKVLEDLGLSLEATEGILLSREITINGRNYCRVNGKIIPLSMFQTIGRQLVDINSQHEQLTLLSATEQLALLDARGGAEINHALVEVATYYNQLEQVSRKLKSLVEDPEEREKEIAFYQFQVNEIDRANLVDGDEEELIQRKNILSNFERLMTGTAQAYELIFSGGTTNSAYDQLSVAVEQLEQLVSIDESLSDTLSMTSNCLYQIEEAGRELQNYLSQIDFNSGELDDVILRLDNISDLKRKYGSSIKKILAYKEEIKKKLEDYEQRQETIEKLQSQQEIIESSYNQAALKLSQLRKSAARQLEQEVENALKELDMPTAKFQCFFTQSTNPAKNGLDILEFYISPNPGEPLKPLAKIASGGEIARIMLALKSILADVEAVETMVFDEADSGIGGLTAAKVGQKLVEISEKRQVICITHSPQIACFGEFHFRLYKDTVEGRTFTKGEVLSQEYRIEELARMLGGGPEGATATKHAKQLLQNALDKKCV